MAQRKIIEILKAKEVNKNRRENVIDVKIIYHLFDV